MPLDSRTNVRKNKSYDQIAFKTRRGKLKRGPSRPNAGAFDFFASVFTKDEWETYYEAAAATGRPMTSWDQTMRWPQNDRVLTRREYFEQWRTWQISDHMPLWLELRINFTDEYLARLARLP